MSAGEPDHVTVRMELLVLAKAHLERMAKNKVELAWFKDTVRSRLNVMGDISRLAGRAIGRIERYRLREEAPFDASRFDRD